MTESERGKSVINVTLAADLVSRAQAECLDVSELVEQAIAAALDRRARATWDALILQACQIHELYLAKYGSVGEALRATPDDDE